MPDPVSHASLGGSLAALFAATTCCILPMSLMIAGLGGSWMAVFAPVSAVSPYVIGLSIVLLAVAWFLSLRRGASRRRVALLSAGSTLSALAWLIVANDEPLTMFFLSRM